MRKHKKMINKLADLHAQCFPHRPWTAADFADLKKSGCDIVASDNGFIVWRVIADEAELITIGVAPTARNTGIASAMLAIMMGDVKKRGAKKIFLEVAENNTPALALYARAGFKSVGQRPKYYDGVDAIIMECQI